MKIITCYENPDMDGLACVIAYSEYLNKIGLESKPKISGKIHEESKFIIQKYGLELPEFRNYDKNDEIIMVDASDLNGWDQNLDPQNVTEIIDHRKVNDAHLFPNACTQIEAVGAAATLIVEKYMAKDLPVSKESAVLLYGAIVSNTLNFQARVTTDRDRVAAKWLNDKLSFPDKFVHEMFAAKSDFSGNKLIKAIEHDTASFKRGKFTISINQLEMLEAEKLVTYRADEIISLLIKLKKQNKLDFIMLTIIDLEAGFNLFLTPDEILKMALTKIFGVEFRENIAKREGFIMRKEIVPLLLPELDKI